MKQPETYGLYCLHDDIIMRVAQWLNTDTTRPSVWDVMQHLWPEWHMVSILDPLLSVIVLDVTGPPMTRNDYDYIMYLCAIV